MEFDTPVTITQLNEQLRQKELECLDIQEKFDNIQHELKTCKEFFGYESDMSLQDMHKYKDDCEDDEKLLKDTDQEYADECEKSDEISDLVVVLGEYQYVVVEIYGQIKQLAPEQNAGLRKNFTSDFMALKNSIPDENVDKFFDLIGQWLHFQRKIHLVDKKIINAKG